MKFTKKYEYEIEIDEEKLFRFVKILKKNSYFWPENKDIVLENGAVINDFPWQVRSWVVDAFDDRCFERNLDFLKINGYAYDGFDEISLIFSSEMYEDIQEAIIKLIVEKETKNA